MAATLRHIAATTGLSYVTVADVLSPLGKRRDRYSEETQRRVTEAANRLGYRPNRGAQAISTGRFGSISLLTSVNRGLSTIPQGLLDGIQNGLEARTLHLSIARLRDEELTDPEFVPQILREWSSDGLLIDYTHRVPDAMQVLIERHGLPAIWLNVKRPSDTIRPDDYQGGVLMAQALLKRGHRRIAYVEVQHGRDVLQDMHYSTLDRQAGFEETVRKAGHEPWVIWPARSMPEPEWLAWGRTFLSASDRPTAVVAPSGPMANVIYAAACTLGLRVPEDLSLLMIADTPFDFAGQAIARVGMSRVQLGREAVEMLIEKIDNGTRFEARLLPYALYEDGPTLGVPSL